MIAMYQEEQNEIIQSHNHTLHYNNTYIGFFHNAQKSQFHDLNWLYLFFCFLTCLLPVLSQGRRLQSGFHLTTFAELLL